MTASSEPSSAELAFMTLGKIADRAQKQGVTPTREDILNRKNMMDVYVGIVALALVRSVGAVVEAENPVEKAAAMQVAAATIDENPEHALCATTLLQDLQQAKMFKERHPDI